MERQRNNTLEIMKLIASYMVILIHFYFKDGFGGVMDALARFAVPLFFIVSGFYSYQISLDKIKKRIKRIAYISLSATFLYTAFNVAPLILAGNTAELSAYFERYLDLRVLLRLFVFNIPLSSEHLWFLLALIYVYVIFYLAAKYKVSDAWVLGISLLLLSVHIVAGEFALAIGVDLKAFIVRNFLLMGVPFFGLGLVAKKYEERILKTPDIVVIVMLVLGVLETCLSRTIIGKNELYVGSLFVCLSIVAVFIKYSGKEYPEVVNKISSCNIYIYIALVGDIGCAKSLQRVRD